MAQYLGETLDDQRDKLQENLLANGGRLIHYLFAYWVILGPFCCPLIFFKINFFFKNQEYYSIRFSNSLDPDQARYNDRPDLGPNCFQKLS